MNFIICQIYDNGSKSKPVSVKKSLSQAKLFLEGRCKNYENSFVLEESTDTFAIAETKENSSLAYLFYGQSWTKIHEKYEIIRLDDEDLKIPEFNIIVNTEDNDNNTDTNNNKIITKKYENHAEKSEVDFLNELRKKLEARRKSITGK